MPQLTWIQRVSNPLILVAEENRDLDEFTQLAKRLFKTLTPSSPPRQLIEAGKHYFLYVQLRIWCSPSSCPGVILCWRACMLARLCPCEYSRGRWTAETGPEWCC